MKEFIGKSVPAYKFRDNVNIEKIEQLADAILSVVSGVNRKINFNEKSNLTDRVFHNAKGVIKSDQESFKILCDALRVKAKERGLNTQAVDKLIDDLSPVLTAQRPISPLGKDLE